MVITLFIPSIGVPWTTAKALASSLYYGLQGYLATITAADEAKIRRTSSRSWMD
jgi:hypothetical protein